MVEEPRATSEDDPALVEGFRRGDPEAFERIVGSHRRAIYAVALRYLGNHADADEAAQQALVRAWNARSRFRGDSRLSTWLTRIVINVARSLRSRAPRVEALDDAAEPKDPRAGADATLHVDQARERVRQAVDTLPPRQREVVLLKVFSEMTYKEVATVLELSEGAVKAHLHQAVANLRRAMTVTTEDSR